MLICLAVSGCSNSGKAVANYEKEKKEITEINQKIISALNNSEFTEISKYFSSASSSFRADGTELFSWTNMLPTPPPGSATIQPVYKVKVDYFEVKVSGDSAYAAMYESGSVFIPPSTNVKGPWRASIFWIKENGKWVVAHDHLSDLKVVKLKYLAQLPKEYRKGSGKKWPMILFLHGSGERGDNLELVKKLGIPNIAEKKNLQFVAISPQCPANSGWDTQIYALNTLLDEIIEKYDVDISRIYLTGLSMGGLGTWNFAMTYPERFAAIAPVSAWANTSNIERLKDIPVWAFHGESDVVVPVSYEQKAVDALNACGGNVKSTIYSGIGHESGVWVQAYDDPLFTWFLSHTK
jgi:predicted esterase